MTGAFIKRKARGEAALGVMQPPASACQEPLEARRGRKGPLWSLQRKHGPAHSLILELWPSELGKNKFLSC